MAKKVKKTAKKEPQHQPPRQETFPGDLGPSKGPPAFDSFAPGGRARRQGGSGQAKRGG